MSFEFRFDIRQIITASLVTIAMAMPAMAQDAAPGGSDTATASPKEKVLANDLSLGKKDAPLTVYEYISFTCPHCATFHQESFPELKSEYIDTGKVYFVQRDVYFDQVGLWAGILARCDEKKFYPVSGMLLDEQAEWLSAQNGDEVVANLRKIGARAGMTAEQVDACWNDKARAESLVETYQKNATADKIQGTPSFVIGGELIANQPWADLKAVIDKKLAEAEKTVPAN